MCFERTTQGARALALLALLSAACAQRGRTSLVGLCSVECAEGAVRVLPCFVLPVAGCALAAARSGGFECAHSRADDLLREHVGEFLLK